MPQRVLYIFLLMSGSAPYLLEGADQQEPGNPSPEEEIHQAIQAYDCARLESLLSQEPSPFSLEQYKGFLLMASEQTAQEAHGVVHFLFERALKYRQDADSQDPLVSQQLLFNFAQRRSLEELIQGINLYFPSRDEGEGLNEEDLAQLRVLIDREGNTLLHLAAMDKDLERGETKYNYLLAKMAFDSASRNKKGKSAMLLFNTLRTKKEEPTLWSGLFSKAGPLFYIFAGGIVLLLFVLGVAALLDDGDEDEDEDEDELLTPEENRG